MAKTVFNHVKFKPGRWQMGRNIFGERCIRVKNEVFCKFFPGLKETEETATLIAAAPKMFWILVTRAEETGEQYLFDVLSGIIGHQITYEEMCELAEQAHQILQRWHKEEQDEKKHGSD